MWHPSRRRHRTRKATTRCTRRPHLYANSYGADDAINAVELTDGTEATFDVTINHATD